MRDAAGEAGEERGARRVGAAASLLDDVDQAEFLSADDGPAVRVVHAEDAADGPRELDEPVHVRGVAAGETAAQAA